MSIGELYLNQVYKVNAPSGTKKTQRNSNVESASKTTGTDGFEISDFGRELNVARKAVKETPDVRQQTVEEIKARFKAGKYEVSTSAIADKLLSEI